jgi:hypothetical protein
MKKAALWAPLFSFVLAMRDAHGAGAQAGRGIFPIQLAGCNL